MEIADMKRIESLRELQRVSTFIYSDLLRFCNNHGLKVYLFGGTLIGAVRHHGYIPWDDDIDVAMSRTDYDKMLTIASNGWISEKCRIVDPVREKAYKGYIPVVAYENSKLLSGQYREKEELKISISIFIYDGVPENKLFQKLFFLRGYMLRAQHALCRADFKNVNTKPAKIFGPIIAPFYKEEDVFKYKDKIIKHIQKYSYDSSKYCACNCDYKASREVCSKYSFEKSTKVEFEGMECYVFSHYLEHLTKYYGDFMQLPPESARKPKHSFDTWIENSFIF